MPLSMDDTGGKDTDSGMGSEEHNADGEIIQKTSPTGTG